MKESSVPQDNSSTYANNKKAIYATKDDGSISIIGSSGWEAEEEATKQALNELEEQAEDAYKEVQSGSMSPLYFHMYNARMDLVVLSQCVGRFQFNVKRDFNPKRFASLSDKALSRYADVMGITIEELKVLPNRDSNE